MGWVAEELAEKSLNAVIQNVAKDPGSSLGLVSEVNYRGSSPKERAQNDSLGGISAAYLAPVFNMRDFSAPGRFSLCSPWPEKTKRRGH